MTEIRSLEELRFFLKEQIVPVLSKQTVVLISGELGVGKTQSVKFLIELLGGTGAVSPTFSVINSYETKIAEVFHVDLYRVKDEDDLESTGFWDLFRDENIVMIEWAEKLPYLSFPKSWKVVSIQIDRKGEVRFFKAGPSANRL